MAVASPVGAAEPEADPWFAKDKALHCSVSGVIAGGSYAAGAAIFDARGHALLAAGALTLTIGAGKELVDLAGLGDPSWKDFAWDAIGAAIGLGLAWTVDVLIRGIGERHPPLGAPRAARAARAAARAAASGFLVRF